jgi:hypothetical protein
MGNYMKKTYIALALASLLGASSVARADAFARSYNEVTNLVITASAGTNIGGSVNNSSATACLPNGTCLSQGGAGATDSPAAQIGLPGYSNNSYTSNQGAGFSYAVADASIDSEQLLGAPFTRARSFAEGNLLGAGTASANAGNSSATLLSTTVEVGGAGATLNFRFDANPFIRAHLSNNAGAASQAEGSMSLNFNIIDNTGRVVFNWAPDGITGGITGGSESADAFTLNTSLTALSGNPGPLIYNPTGCAPGSIGSGCFNATTDFLGAGIYTLNLSMRENINLQSVAAAVPEPGMYAMLLVGLGLIGFTKRRRTGSAKFK